MWKPRKEDEAVPPTPPSAVPPKETRPVDISKPANDYRAEVAHIGKSVVVKGELSGSEDLYLDGEVEGSVELRGHSLTVGPHGRVRAHVRARDVVIHGKVDGNVSAERVELKRSAIHLGNIVTQRVVIEDGAYFKGSIDIQREQNADLKAEVKAAVAAGAAGAPSSASASAASVSTQAPLLDPKR